MLLNLILMQFILFLTLTIVKLSNHLDEKPNLCKFEGFLIQFSQMSAFFWLSALGHNVQKTFKKMRPVSKQRRYKLGIIDDNYRWYALYAWGVPLVVSFITILMQFCLSEEKTEKYYVPGIGKHACFLEPKWGMLFYFHIINGPVMVYLEIRTLLKIVSKMTSYLTFVSLDHYFWIFHLFHMEHLLWSLFASQ